MLTLLRLVLWPFLLLGMAIAMVPAAVWCGALAVFRGMDWIITEAVATHRARQALEDTRRAQKHAADFRQQRQTRREQ